MLAYLANSIQGADTLEHNYSSFYELSAENIQGQKVDFDQFKGKVVLIVNVASYCGLTDRNYKQLVPIYDRYQSEGFEVLAFPCNQFLYQEPGSAESILGFAGKCNAHFMMMSKVSVNGPETHPVYRFLKTSTDREQIDWNFAKYLVSRSGTTIRHYKSAVNPDDMVADIEQMLKE